MPRAETTGRVGPELVVGLTKRNAFRGGEKLDINFHGSHEWQTITGRGEIPDKINCYEFRIGCHAVVPQASSLLGMSSARWQQN